MNKITPTINKDGSESVVLYGQVIDVTGKDSFILFKREYTVARPVTKQTKKKKESEE